ncbi:MAG: glycoside hydrolase family 32 protein [Proteobacteria bacterium]|nr:glycoside hydrolase family 32 protein [Pseudomonadota bacterium]
MRPLYHYAAAANWLSDPNGLVHHDGEWHLFYQYNPQGEDWGHMSWGHAVSTDLATWRELPVAIEDDPQDLIFSGSAVCDPDGRAGFGTNALIALYTASSAQPPQRQSQALAWSIDRGRTWHKYDGNPVVDRGLADFRDPNVFWHEATQRWIMVVALSAEHRALIYGSSDLRHWDELSVVESGGAPGRIWECPLLIELPVEDCGETRWVFKVDVLHDGPGSGTIYRTGTFDGTRFVADGRAAAPWQVADWGSDFYAAIAWHEPRDAKGRPLWVGWMGNHAYQAQLPRQGWRGAMSLPRRLSLVTAGEGWALRQEVEPAAVAGVPTVSHLADAIPVAARIVLPPAEYCTLTVADAAGRQFVIERHAALLSICRRDSVSPVLDTVGRCHVASGAPVVLWFDAGSCEVLSAEGLCALTFQHRLAGESWAMRFTPGGD